MTSLLKKAFLSLTLFFSGALFCTEDTQFKFLKEAAETLCVIFAEMSDSTSPDNKTLKDIFLAISCQDRPLEKKDIEDFLQSKLFTEWLKHCNNFWDMEKKLLEPAQKGWANYICKLFVDPKNLSANEFVSQLKSRALKTTNDALKKRVERFLKLIMREINRIYISLEAKPQKDAFKETVEILSLELIIPNLIFFSTPAKLPRYEYARRKDLPEQPTIILNMPDDLSRLTLEYIENGVSFNPTNSEEIERFVKELLAERAAARHARRTASGGPAAGSDGAPSS